MAEVKEGIGVPSVFVLAIDKDPREVCLRSSLGSNLLVASLCSKQSVVAKQGVVQRCKF